MKRPAEYYRWLLWTARPWRRTRHADGDLAAERADWTHEELASLPHIPPERPIKDQAAADAAEEGRRG